MVISDPYFIWSLYIPACEHCMRGKEEVGLVKFESGVLVMLAAAGFEPKFPNREELTTKQIVAHLDTVRQKLDSEASKYSEMIENPNRRWISYGMLIDNILAFIKMSKDYPNALIELELPDDES